MDIHGSGPTGTIYFAQDSVVIIITMLFTFTVIIGLPFDLASRVGQEC